jgi:hypothetical protein
MKDCIEEGILQSYVDNELAPETAERVAAHIAACQSCAEAFNEASNETAIFATAFEAEMALDVPTVRLRERIDAAIAEINRSSEIAEQKPGWTFNGWLTSLAGLFKVSPQRAVGFASLIALIAFAAIFAAIKLRPAVSSEPPSIVASNDKPATRTPPPPATTGKTTPAPDVKNANGGLDNGGGNNPSGKPATKPKKQVKPTLVPEPGQLPKDELATTLPGEENYLKAIDSLSVEIEASGEATMKPSLRAEYERNLAIVDQAIDSTRRVARRNPKDPDAASFLYSSYQSKLDLLSAVAEQVRPSIATR